MNQSCGMGILPVLILLAGKMPAPQEILGYFFIWKSLIDFEFVNYWRNGCNRRNGRRPCAPTIPINWDLDEYLIFYQDGHKLKYPIVHCYYTQKQFYYHQR
jgi:hypothetical protein